VASHEETRRHYEQRRVGKAHVISDDLPNEIVRPLAQFGTTLLKHAQAHRGRSLADHEEGVLGAWRTAAPALLEAVLRLATTGLGEDRTAPRRGIA
jgi:hypothetical protein